MDRPLVSAILAVRNEESYIERVLQSLLLQDTSNCELEFIVVDGESTDATPDLVKRIAGQDGRVRLLINHQRKTPYAFNLGIQAARGKYVCILGAHTTYAQDYVATCLQDLHRHSAGGCSGVEVTRPADNETQARLIAWVLSHPFGTSTGSMRTRKAGFADTIPYPIFLKSTLIEVGAYNTRLHRNQDNDLSQRLRASGHKLYMTDRTHCEYFVSPTLIALSRYAFKTGFWNIISFKSNRASMSLRHFVPGVFVAGSLLCVAAYLVAGSAGGFWLRLPLFFLATMYAIACLGAALHIALRERAIEAFLTPFIFLALHTCYGAGVLTAIIVNARPARQQPDLPPKAVEYS